MNPMRSTSMLGCAVLLVLLVCSVAQAMGMGGGTQEPDPNYIPVVTDPAYALGSGPVIAVDSGHNNKHTVLPGRLKVRGSYTGFKDLLQADNAVVLDFAMSYATDCIGGIPDCPYFQALLDIDVLVIASPNEEITAAEAAAIAVWVRGDLDTCVNCSRSLMLISDHAPSPDLFSPLSEALGLNWLEGSVEALFIQNPEPDPLFGDLDTSHVVTEGRNETEVVTEVRTFKGSCFSEDPAAAPLTDGVSVLTLLPQASDPCDERSQGMLYRHGGGSVYASGEAAMFTAQRLVPSDGPTIPFGMHTTAACEPEGGVLPAQLHCNEQYLLNIVHWLDGELDEDGDGVIDREDNCRDVPNPNQDDTDGDLCGNVCDGDYNQDGWTDSVDFEIFDNDLFGTFDLRGDHTEPVVGPVGVGDFGVLSGLFNRVPGPSGTTPGTLACPIIAPNISPNDLDFDGVANEADNCPIDHNPGQEDNDGDGVGNVCDPTPNGTGCRRGKKC